jgi:hypothetical protein
VPDWHWEPVTDDLLDELPPAALAAVRQVAEELTVRESMIFLDGREVTGEPPGLRTVQPVDARLPDRRPRRTRGHHPSELDQLTQAATVAPRQRGSPQRNCMPKAEQIDIFQTFIQVLLSGAGGARTHDRRIMRTTAPCIVRTTCTDTTEPCR